MSSDVPRQSNASADSPAALTIEFDTDAPVLNPGAARALLILLLATDHEGVVDGAVSADDEPTT